MFFGKYSVSCFHASTMAFSNELDWGANIPQWWVGPLNPNLRGWPQKLVMNGGPNNVRFIGVMVMTHPQFFGGGHFHRGYTTLQAHE